MRTDSRQNVTDCGEASSSAPAPSSGVGIKGNADSGGLASRWGRENPRSAALAVRARALLPAAWRTTCGSPIRSRWPWRTPAARTSGTWTATS